MLRHPSLCDHPTSPSPSLSTAQLKKGPLPSDHKTVDKLRQIASGALPEGRESEGGFSLPDVDPEVVREEKSWLEAVVRAERYPRTRRG